MNPVLLSVYDVFMLIYYVLKLLVLYISKYQKCDNTSGLLKEGTGFLLQDTLNSLVGYFIVWVKAEPKFRGLKRVSLGEQG